MGSTRFLTDASINQFQQNGYLVLENFILPAECDEMIQASMEFTKDLPSKDKRSVFSANENEPKQLHDDYFIKSNDKISYFYEKDALDADGELKVDPSVCLNKVGHALHLLHPMFRCYTYSERVKAVCRDLNLRDPCVVQSMIIYKNAGIGGEVKTHQDCTYLHTEPYPPIGFWYALVDATIENGCLWIAPGSHTTGVHRRLVRSEVDGQTTLAYDRPESHYRESSFIPVPVSKGDCIILHGHVVHKSSQNKSNKSRPAYTFHVIERYNNKYSPENWLQEGPNAPFVNLYTTKQYCTETTDDKPSTSD